MLRRSVLPNSHHSIRFMLHHPSPAPCSDPFPPTMFGILKDDLLALTDGTNGGEARFAVEKGELAKSAPGPVLQHLCLLCPYYSI